MEVSVIDLKRYFGNTKAVDGISFAFSAGHVFGFVGPNGAGKTTTMRVLATIDEPTAGDARLDGVSLVEEPEWARRHVGFMPDALPTHSDMTVHEYLDFFARAYGLRGRKRTTVVQSVEEFVSLNELRDKMLRALSKGMKQRVSLARAIVHDPPVLVLDEPAAGLDPRARVELRELIKALAERGKAILVSSHILTELAEICNGAVIIEQGRILRAGQMDAIIQAESVQKVVVIRSAGPAETLYKALLEMPEVRNAKVVGQEVEAELDGADDAAGKLLAALVAKGVAVSEFRQKRMDLEDVFMSVTKGKVQ